MRSTGGGEKAMAVWPLRRRYYPSHGTEQKVKVVYNGTLSGDTIKGSLTMGEMGEGTFVGKRK